jgi:hypothetical protein
VRSGGRQHGQKWILQANKNFEFYPLASRKITEISNYSRGMRFEIQKRK